jgi:hypothetical protein
VEIVLSLAFENEKEDDQGYDINHADLKAPGAKAIGLAGYEIDVFHTNCEKHHQEEDNTLDLGILQRQKVA